MLDSVRAMESLALIAIVAACGLNIAYLVTRQDSLRLGMAAAAIAGGKSSALNKMHRSGIRTYSQI